MGQIVLSDFFYCRHLQKINIKTVQLPGKNKSYLGDKIKAKSNSEKNVKNVLLAKSST